MIIRAPAPLAGQRQETLVAAVARGNGTGVGIGSAPEPEPHSAGFSEAHCARLMAQRECDRVLHPLPPLYPQHPCACQ